MGIGIFQKAYDWIGGAFGFQGGQFVRIWGAPESDSGETVTPMTSLGIIVLLRCATLIAGAAASLPIDVLEKQGGVRKPVANHPVERLLDWEPNPEMSSMDFRAQQWLSFLLWGNSYAHIVRDGARPLALWPMLPQCVQVKREASTGDLLYQYDYPGMKSYIYSADEVLHVRDFSLDGINGLSRIEQARNGIGLHRATEKTASRFFKNGAQLNLQLEIPAALAQKTVEQLRKDFHEEYGGPEKAYRIAISHSGSKLSPIAVNPRDAQFIEQREYNDVQICMLFGVPPHMVGIVSKSTSWGAGIAEQKQGFLDFTVSPLLSFHEKAYERCLLTKAEGRRYIKHNVNAFLRADIKARFDAYVAAVGNGIMNRDEVRALEDMGPCDGGDIHTVQSQYIPLDQVGVVPPKPPARPEGVSNV